MSANLDDSTHVGPGSYNTEQSNFVK